MRKRVRGAEEVPEERHSSPLAQEAKSSRLLSGLRVLSCLSVVLSRDVTGPFLLGFPVPSVSFIKIIVSACVSE